MRTFSAVVGFTVALASAAPVWAEVVVGQAAPDFSLPDETGKLHKLSSLRGRVVVLEWTNPECPFVKRHYQSNTMETLAKRFAGEAVVWLALNSTHHNKADDTRAWRTQEGFAYPTLQDNSGEVGRRYGARTTPHMFVIDTQGVVQYAGAVDDNPRGDNAKPVNYIEQAVTSVLAGKKPPVQSSAPYGCSVKYKSS